MHASIVLGQDILEYAALFAEIADAYFDREMYAEASNIYQMLGADAGVSSFERIYMQITDHCISRRAVRMSFCKPRHVIECWAT